MVGFKNAFSEISAGIVWQVVSAAEAAPSTKLEMPQVIPCGRFRSLEVSRYQGDLSYDPDSKTSDFGVLDQDEHCQTLQTEWWAFVNLGHLKSCILMHVKRDLG